MHFRIVLALALVAAPLAAVATPPEACSILAIEEVNSIAAGEATRVEQRKSGNPSECAYIDKHRGAVLVVSIREVQYAPENELQYERENLEKIYRGRVKWLKGVGENGFWMPVNKQLVFRKAKTLVSVTFSRVANQNEADSSQVARMIESRLK
ncbi:MAG TPA: hypothetical protein VF386_14420 [Usitatibacter sp.]